MRVHVCVWVELDQPNLHVGMATSAAIYLPLHQTLPPPSPPPLQYINKSNILFFYSVAIDLTIGDPFCKTRDRYIFSNIYLDSTIIISNNNVYIKV